MRLHPQPNTTKPTENNHAIDVNHFLMQIPTDGYYWLDQATPLRSFPDRLGAGPYLVIKPTANPSGTPAREYFPLREKPYLFRRFRDLELAPDAYRQFANEYGWIGETGKVNDGRRKLVGAVAAHTWRDEIQTMILADHLWECICNDERRVLRKYFTWHPTHFDVRMSIGMRERSVFAENPSIEHLPTWAKEIAKQHSGNMQALEIGAKDHPEQQVPERSWLSWLVNPREVQLLEAIGWHRGDVLGPARVALMGLINPRLNELCHPRLYLRSADEFVGHLSPNNLLGCIWLQFYMTVIGQLKLRFCTICKREMDVSESRSTRKSHDRCSRRPAATTVAGQEGACRPALAEIIRRGRRTFCTKENHYHGT